MLGMESWVEREYIPCRVKRRLNRRKPEWNGNSRVGGKYGGMKRHRTGVRFKQGGDAASKKSEADV